MQQKYRSYEIVVVDDGSTDKTAARLTGEYGFSRMKFERFRGSLKYRNINQILSVTYQGIRLYLIVKENGGKGDALNAGIDFCHGIFFVCIDADCILSPYTLAQLAEILAKRADVVAIGGRILPNLSFPNYCRDDRSWLEKYLLNYQELEYGIAFSIARPLFDHIGTTMLVSGALGLFRTETVIDLGGYALDTVGEDMELVMRIRQSAAKERCPVGIVYAKGAICYTELPWNIRDWVKQRIRWTVGLSEVLWKYRGMLIGKEYSIAEKITFLYYLLLERYAPHIELASIITCMICGASEYALVLILITILIQLLLSVAGSYQSLRNSIKASDSRLRALAELLLILVSFISVYHIAHSLIRLISVPYCWGRKHILRKRSVAWNSPIRM